MPDEKPDVKIFELRNKILKDEWSFLGDAMMIRNTFKKQVKSPFTLICYFVLMSVSFCSLEFSSYDILRVSNSSDWLLYGSQGLFGLAMLLWVIVWLSDPGTLKHDP